MRRSWVFVLMGGPCSALWINFLLMRSSSHIPSFFDLRQTMVEAEMKTQWYLQEACLQLPHSVSLTLTNSADQGLYGRLPGRFIDGVWVSLLTMWSLLILWAGTRRFCLFLQVFCLLCKCLALISSYLTVNSVFN